MDKHLRNISVAALVVYQDRKQFIIGIRDESDHFYPGNLTLPCGRVSGNELLEDRLFVELGQEVGISVDREQLTYIGESTFQRGEFPVNQLCFGLITTEYSIPSSSRELKRIEWVTPLDFFEKFSGRRYFKELSGFIKKAQKIGFLK